MGNMSIRNIPEDVHDALKRQAYKNGRSAEAEVRAMIVENMTRAEKGGFGTRLRKVFEDIDDAEISIERDKTPAEPADIS